MSNPLGRQTRFPDAYNPNLLFPIARSEVRQALKLNGDLPFEGEDIWNCYELSWLGVSGEPNVAVLRLQYPSTSPNLVESKSLKLYLGGLNNTRAESPEKLAQLIRSDLERVVGATCSLMLMPPEQWQELNTEAPVGRCIDDFYPQAMSEGREVTVFKDSKQTTETLYSNILRSLCPVTGQPDWGTVTVSYSGSQINSLSLLSYFVSLREHEGFHEHLCEKIFCDIQERCAPKDLTVLCSFTRRGGIDINPIRYTKGSEPLLVYRRLARQ